MTASQLTLYNGALRVLGERRLASLSEGRQSRRLLDDAWAGGLVRTCLEAGQWDFAVRTSMLTYDSTIEPDFGYTRVFAHPDDYVRLIGISDSDQFNGGFNLYVDEAGYWFADVDSIYVRYISDDTAYGMDYAKWPESFTNYVEHVLALEISRALTSSESKRKEIKDDVKEALKDARAKDAISRPVATWPHGSFAKARHNGDRRHRRNRSSLIG